MKLTQRQQEILNFLRTEQDTTGIIPSTREVQKHFGFASQTAVMSHLRALERKGVIVRPPGKARAIQFTEKLGPLPVSPGLERAFIKVPVYGQIAAGMASITEEMVEGEVAIHPESLSIRGKEPLFALRVRGESMINAHICDGDVVVLQKREPSHGDVVAALIDGETTLKRFQRHNGRVYLKAENPDFPDLKPTAELEVQGVMVALIRPV